MYFFSMSPTLFEVRLALFPLYIDTLGTYLDRQCLSLVIVRGGETYSTGRRSTWAVDASGGPSRWLRALFGEGCVRVVCAGDSLRLPRVLLEEGWTYSPNQVESWVAKLFLVLACLIRTHS